MADAPPATQIVQEEDPDGTDRSRVIDASILYVGTPVVLISTRNHDGTANLAPISSAWWLGMDGMIGMGARSHTVANLRREGECVLNLPSVELVDAVDRLALTTGSDPVPPSKLGRYDHVKDKFGHAGLTPLAADLVGALRVAECPMQLEARVTAIRPLGGPEGRTVSVEVEVVRTHVHEDVLLPGHRHHIDADAWRPLIMSFLEFYGLGRRVHPSRLAEVF